MDGAYSVDPCYLFETGNSYLRALLWHAADDKLQLGGKVESQFKIG